MSGEIVLGYDGSECAEAALAQAIRLALSLGSPLVVVYAAEPPGRSVGEEYREHRKALMEIGEERTAKALAAAEAQGVAAERLVLEERPAEGRPRRRGARCGHDRRRHVEREADSGCDPRLRAVQAPAPVDGAGARGSASLTRPFRAQVGSACGGDGETEREVAGPVRPPCSRPQTGGGELLFDGGPRELRAHLHP